LTTSLLAADPKITAEKSDSGVDVKIDGKPFATYVFKSGAKPIVWPIIGPTGEEMTRAWPMKDGVEGEKKDHIHHRSFWFTHGNINGVDFWAETAKVQGTIEHQELTQATSGKVATISTRNAWKGPDGKVIIHDEPVLTFGADDKSRWIDFRTKVIAVADEVTFGDTKEGAFGVRVAETMKVEANKGGKIITSEGLTDKDAWGKPAKWVDYHGRSAARRWASRSSITPRVFGIRPPGTSAPMACLPPIPSACTTSPAAPARTARTR
jgi:hypothetical protein